MDMLDWEFPDWLEEDCDGTTETTPPSEEQTDIPETNVQAEKNVGLMTQSLKDVFDKLLVDGSVNDMKDLVEKVRVIVSMDRLKELKGNVCNDIVDGKACNSTRNFHMQSVKGSVATLSWDCSNGHKGTWVSSEVLTRSYFSNFYVNDVLICASVLLTGNNYSKFQLLCKALNAKVPEMSTFLRVQKHFTAPVIVDFWNSMKEDMISALKNLKQHCLCGDARNDSPGFCARYCVYVLMEHFTKAVIDVEILDKRETGGKSPNMEPLGLSRILERLMKDLDIGELCTDASSTIIKLVETLKGLSAEGRGTLYNRAVGC